MRRVVAVLSLLAAGTAAGTPAGTAAAQGKRPVAIPESMTALDTWVVIRLRGSQLLPDSTPAVRSVANDAVLPRIESVREGGRVDSLYALHYAERPGVPALASSGSVRIVGPTGTIIAARRPFRAPRAPGADSNQEKDWRYGWSYLVLLPKTGRIAPATVFRGWMLVDTTAAR